MEEVQETQLARVATLNRPMLSFWPYVWRAWLPLVILVLVNLVLSVSLRSTSPFVLGCMLLALKWNSFERRSEWLRRIASTVRRFRTTSDGRVILHYAPELGDKEDMTRLLVQCHAELGRLAERFGFRLRGRIVVFLFADHQEIAKLLGAGYGGTAFSLANAIFIADNNCVQESMRHELTHLFSSRWSRLAPPLLEEGLAVWLQETVWEHPIDKVVRAFLGHRSLKLRFLLQPKFFFSEQHRHACYVIAGSFTAFLIRRYGWPKFRRLFRLCNGKHFPAKFEKCFGVSLEKAEWQWRNEMTVMEVLNRRLGRDVCF